MPNTQASLRLLFPQWQGGNNPPYFFGSQLLAWLAPPAQGVVLEISVPEPTDAELANEEGIVGRRAIVEQLLEAQDKITRNQPETIVTLGGDCLVSLAPFAWLAEKYGDKLGVLWIDSHPDVMTPQQYPHAHAHVLGALMGNGDVELTQVVRKPLSPGKVLIAGIHSPLDVERQFISEHGITTLSPAELRQHPQAIDEWIAREGIEYLAVHLDLDVLDPALFRAVLFARPGRGVHDFGDVAEGKLTIDEVVNLIHKAAVQAKPVGLTVAEHLPWDALNLKNMLEALPLLS
ncbi:TPA: arginase family protein [Klebsiella aerogenes]|uniref:arginase family protein n=1 Tax=Klebsiella TaxID=570 RepID=UPI0022A50657|nr:arginase family protein [Klebsiella sp. 141203]ELA2273907.1 arginase family protein [Klebsiella aerogenes]MDU9363195.1 arginase family protein [Klebsiella sp. 141203]HBW5535902.1 arginase family protein [Klebsiella aerogenes]HCS4219106.1 arginase family protein [Klebsiella aerogenes]HCT4435436.1 arginase family protein [Klebsiella aerogenes]